MSLTVPALWTRHRPVALAIAAEWRIPGLDADDVRQEALIALWEACRAYDRDRGRFPPFARLVIRRRLADLLRAATTRGRDDRNTVRLGHEIGTLGGVDSGDGREQLSLLVDAFSALTPRERRAVKDHANGVPATSSKAHDVALYRARVKLRAAA